RAGERLAEDLARRCDAVARRSADADAHFSAAHRGVADPRLVFKASARRAACTVALAVEGSINAKAPRREGLATLRLCVDAGLRTSAAADKLMRRRGLLALAWPRDRQGTAPRCAPRWAFGAR